MVVRVEREPGGDPSRDGDLCRKIERDLRKETLVSATVEILDYQGLPRTERKAKRVFDHRTF